MIRIAKSSGLFLTLVALSACAPLRTSDGPVFEPTPATRVTQQEVEARYRTRESRFIDVEGVRVHYRDEGRGPVIVLLHGSFGSLRNFDGMTMRLRKRFRVIRYDQPPAGLSGEVPENFSGTMEGFLAKFLDRIEVRESVVLLGTSSGGIIAYRFAATYPARVKALVLSNVPPSAPVDNAGAARRAPADIQRKLAACTKAGEPRDRDCWRVFLDFNFVRKQEITPALVREYTDFNRKVGAQRMSVMTPLMRDDVAVREFLGKITAPTLLLWGREDYVLPPETMTTMASRLTAARVERNLMPVVSHYPPLEAPSEVTEATLRFLRSLGDAPVATAP